MAQRRSEGLGLCSLPVCFLPSSLTSSLLHPLTMQTEPACLQGESARAAGSALFSCMVDDAALLPSTVTWRKRRRQTEEGETWQRMSGSCVVVRAARGWRGCLRKE